ncbi:alpha/beta hydrolase [Microbacterium sp. zg.B48]|uniref:alpha/beta fold hydrolase n=1 Tax=Microbacterium sp. zg.B48 TaxID=2969408 RepID=UPI00214CEC6B|nr:alpha/beta hydrolase [Microbacterium sp. zg.B48]MCR2763114.1 alpha/beta hydrolase [Microbacterium sp. zg.B48]
MLIHGIGVSHRYYDRLHRVLATFSDVHSIDLPGFGGLPAPVGALSVADMASALAALLKELGLTRAVLVGHSMGAQWVVELAAQHPDLASHVVIIGPVSDDRHRAALAQCVALAVDTVGEPPSGNAVVFSDYLRCPPWWYFAQLRQMVSYRIEDRAAALTMPLLVMRGGNDPIAGLAWCHRLRDRADRAELVVVAGHRHLVHYTAPREVASAVVDFVARHAAQPRDA